MTGEGAARAEVDRPAAGESAFLLVLTHGAGGNPDSPDLLAVAGAALGLGGTVARVTQPYRVKGRRAPGSPDRQDAAWAEVIAALRAAAGAGLPLIQGGRSNGARVACRTARAVGARDRKSTRLNSSHVSTSYAVFCLKKQIRSNWIKVRPRKTIQFKT